MLHLFIIQKTFLGSSLVMNMHAYDLQSHPLALNSRLVPHTLKKLKYLKNWNEEYKFLGHMKYKEHTQAVEYRGAIFL